MGRYVARDVLALVKVAVVHVLLHRAWTHLVHSGSHHAAALVRIVQDVRVRYVLGVYATSTLDHWELRRSQVFVRIGCEAANWLLGIRFVIPTGG